MLDPSNTAQDAIHDDFHAIKEADLDFVLPRPTEEGVAELRAFYYAKYSKPLDEDTAREVLAHILTVVWNTALTNLECDTHSTRENPTTSGK